MDEKKSIVINEGHVRRLRALGDGGLLLWDDRRGVVTFSSFDDDVPDHEKMIIAGSGTLDWIAETRAKEGGTCDGPTLATALTAIANEQRTDWARLKDLTTDDVVQIRRHLADHEILLKSCPDMDGNALTDRYVDPVLPQFEIRVSVTRDHLEPMMIEIHSTLDKDKRLLVWAMAVGELTPPIAAAVCAGAIRAALEQGNEGTI